VNQLLGDHWSLGASYRLTDADLRSKYPEFASFPPLYDYAARYTAGTTEFFCPARLDDETAERAQAVALNAHLLLGLRDLSRTDVIVDSDGVPWFLEVNVAPGMTETSLFPQALAAADVGLGTVIAQLVETAVERA
jgi:D-alanine-D-alanine ligase